MNLPKITGPELVAVWSVAGRDPHGILLTSTNAFILFRMPDGTGILAGATTAGFSDSCLAISREDMPRAEAIVGQTAEDSARLLAEAGRQVTQRFIEVRSSDPILIRERLDAACLPVSYASPPQTKPDQGAVRVSDAGDGFAGIRWLGAPSRRGTDDAFSRFRLIVERHVPRVPGRWDERNGYTVVELDCVANVVRALEVSGYRLETDEIVKAAVRHFEAETSRLEERHRL